MGKASNQSLLSTMTYALLLLLLIIILFIIIIMPYTHGNKFEVLSPINTNMAS